MSFTYTTASVFEPIEDMTITHEQTLADLLRRHEEERERARCPSRTLLSEAHQALEQRLVEMPLDYELLVFADMIYNDLGMYHEIIGVLRTFLKQSPDHVERAWAHWHLVDYLALAREHESCVDEQRQLLTWAESTLPPEQCFFVLSDGTQALSWLKSGVVMQWFHQVDQLFAIASRTRQNRLDRFYTLRTAIVLCLRMPDLDRLSQYMDLLSQLEQEEPDWSEGAWVHIEKQILELKVALLQEHEDAVQRIVQDTRSTLTVWEGKLQPQDSKDIQRFRSLQHNLGTPLYQSRHYDLAIPCFQKAVAYQTTAYYSYLWLAACLWQTTKKREMVEPLLQQAASRFDEPGSPWEHFRRLPEFQDVREDTQWSAFLRF